MKRVQLNEMALLDFAKAFKYEESIAALSAMSGVKIATLDRLIAGDRYDPILIVSKTIGLEWATVRALILLRLGPNRVPSPADIEGARVNFARLMPSTAERVVTFWKIAAGGVASRLHRHASIEQSESSARLWIASCFAPAMTIWPIE